MRKLILASSSPRRRELLAHLGIPFELNSPDIEEESSFTKPEQIVIDIAEQKGKAVIDSFSNEKSQQSFVISSDTIVVYDGKIFGKPIDKEDSKRILSTLSGKTHQVMTAVAFHFILEGELICHSFIQSTDVEFAHIDENLLRAYIKDGEGDDKAGSYGIQGKGLAFIKSVKGSYSNVVGFPLQLVYENLTLVNEKYFKRNTWNEIFE